MCGCAFGVLKLFIQLSFLHLFTVRQNIQSPFFIDYVGIVKALRQALADYTGNRGAGGSDPTVDKDKLIIIPF